jgi:hypothetical protein
MKLSSNFVNVFQKDFSYKTLLRSIKMNKIHLSLRPTVFAKFLS